MIKLFASDLDGTLLNVDHKLDEKIIRLNMQFIVKYVNVT